MRTRPNRDLLRRTIVSAGLSITAPTAYWNLDEASGSARADNCANPCNLSITGTVTQSSGIIGNSASVVSGANRLSNTSIPSKLNVNSTTFSFCGWVNLSNSGGGTLIFENDAGGTNDWTISLTSTTATFTINSTSATVSGTFNTGTWYFIAAYCDGTHMKISVNDGTLSSANSGGLLISTTRIYFLNNFVDNNALQGSLDEVGIWVSHVLTSSEITQLYNSGVGHTFNGTSWV